jgi:sucrose-6-phosphatase
VRFALFVTDLDNTLVGDDLALDELNQFLTKSRQTCGTKIVYATGRSPFLYRQLQAEKKLMPPDAIVTAVGTEIYYDDGYHPDPDWSQVLSGGWQRDQVVMAAAQFPQLAPQPDTEQRPFKVSYVLNPETSVQVLSQLRTALSSRNLSVELIYSGGKDLDILPKGADKGRAIAFLQQQWLIDPAQTLVCGDSGNDLALFRAGMEYGIIVGNAQPELLHWHEQNPSPNRYLAHTFCARGILEGLQHFGFA